MSTRMELGLFAKRNPNSTVSDCLKKYSEVIIGLSKKSNDEILNDEWLNSKSSSDAYAYNMCIAISKIRDEMNFNLYAYLIMKARDKESLFPDDVISLSSVRIAHVIERSFHPIYNMDIFDLKNYALRRYPNDTFKKALMKKGLGI